MMYFANSVRVSATVAGFLKSVVLAMDPMQLQGPLLGVRQSQVRNALALDNV